MERGIDTAANPERSGLRQHAVIGRMLQTGRHVEQKFGIGRRRVPEQQPQAIFIDRVEIALARSTVFQCPVGLRIGEGQPGGQVFVERDIGKAGGFEAVMIPIARRQRSRVFEPRLGSDRIDRPALG
ncbi:hypothetical protein [Sphingopyxis sp.]|uniref:hypothetical protein n=1 Tax=Sphingopyxis sp. TaxID=1908224 RepID=UPI003D6D9806